MADKFYSYDPYDGHKWHETLEQAKDTAENAIELGLDDTWDENVVHVEYGRLVPLAKCARSNYEAADPSNPDCEITKRGWAYRCDYTLEPIPDELAQLRERVSELEAVVKDVLAQESNRLMPHQVVQLYCAAFVKIVHLLNKDPNGLQNPA